MLLAGICPANRYPKRAQMIAKLGQGYCYHRNRTQATLIPVFGSVATHRPSPPQPRHGQAVSQQYLRPAGRPQSCGCGADWSRLSSDLRRCPDGGRRARAATYPADGRIPHRGTRRVRVRCSHCGEGMRVGRRGTGGGRSHAPPGCPGLPRYGRGRTSAGGKAFTPSRRPHLPETGAPGRGGAALVLDIGVWRRPAGPGTLPRQGSAR